MDYYCRLYIDSSLDEGQVRDQIAGIVKGKITRRSITNDTMDIHFSKNDSFDDIKFNSSEDGFLFSKYTAEVDISDESDSSHAEGYQILLCSLIKNLREMGCKVVASCDYEDLIAEKTGWNWSTKTPVHP